MRQMPQYLNPLYLVSILTFLTADPCFKRNIILIILFGRQPSDKTTDVSGSTKAREPACTLGNDRMMPSLANI